MTFPFPVFIQGAAPDATVSYISSANAGSGSSQTFTAQSIGTADADRYVIVGVMQNGSTRPSTPTVTIAGTTATSVAYARNDYGGSASTSAGLQILKVTSGTTADIVVTWNTSCDVTAIGVWRAIGLSGTTANATSSSTASPSSLDLNVTAGGIIVALQANGQYSTATWTGPTEDFDTNFRTYYAYSGASAAYATASTPATVSCTLVSFNVGVGVAASWSKPS